MSVIIGARPCVVGVCQLRTETTTRFWKEENNRNHKTRGTDFNSLYTVVDWLNIQTRKPITSYTGCEAQLSQFSTYMYYAHIMFIVLVFQFNAGIIGAVLTCFDRPWACISTTQKWSGTYTIIIQNEAVALSHNEHFINSCLPDFMMNVLATNEQSPSLLVAKI